jgi:dihydrolipoamide dehydrogenase
VHVSAQPDTQPDTSSAHHFDVVVLGAGPGGYVAAIRAAQLGKTAAVIEKKYWGGVCLNVGCIPSKALLRNAELAHVLTHEKDVFGIQGEATMAFGPTHERSRKVSAGIVKGVHFLMKKNKITEIDGWGTLRPREGQGPGSVDVELDDGSTATYTYDDLIIGTGATTRLIPGTTLSERVVTYEEQILDPELPESIIIAGSGAIGVEFAYVMANFGVDVTIVEFLDRMVPTEDADVSKELLRHYKKLGVKVLLGTKVEGIEDAGAESGQKVKVTVSTSSTSGGNGSPEVLEADKVLQAIGFAPRLEGYGLEALGIPVKRTIETNDHLETIYPNILAAGDVAGPYQFTHVAAHQAWYAAVNGLFGGLKKFKADYTVIPAATFIEPEIARVGLNEREAAEQGVEHEVTRFRLAELDRAIADGAVEGFVKVLTAPGKDKILGVTIVGEHAADLLAEYVLAMKHGLGLNKILGTIHTYPTLSEANKYAAGEWKRAHQPERLLRWVARFHAWQRGARGEAAP